jgi:hypothetical protein
LTKRPIYHLRQVGVILISFHLPMTTDTEPFRTPCQLIQSLLEKRDWTKRVFAKAAREEVPEEALA